MEKVVKFFHGNWNSLERSWNICLGDTPNSSESNFGASFAMSKWLDKMISKVPFQPKPFLGLSAQINLNRELGKLH